MSYFDNAGGSGGANYFSGMSSSSGGGSALDALLASSARRRKEREAAAAAAKAGEHHGLGGLLLNFGDDVKDAAIGFVPGVFNLGKGIVSDAWNVGESIGRGDLSAFEEDEDGATDLFGAIAKDYKRTYGPLFEGDLDKFGKNLYDHPLGPVLDVLTVLTAGAGAAGKGSKLAIKHTGKVTPKQAKRLGLERVDAGSSAATTAAERGATLGKNAFAEGDGVWVPRRRVTRTSSALREKGLMDEEGVLDRRKLLREDRAKRSEARSEASAKGQAWDARTYSDNSFIRSRQELADLVGELFPTVRGLGSDRRAGRQKVQQLARNQSRQSRRDGVTELESALFVPDKLGGARSGVHDPMVQTALDNELRGVKGEDRVKQLKSDMQLLPVLERTLPQLKKEKAVTAKIIRQVAARERLRGDNEAATHYKHLANELVGEAQDHAAGARKAKRSDAPAHSRMADALMKQRIAADIAERGVVEVANDIATRVKMGERSTYYQGTVQKERAAQERLAKNGLDAGQQKIVNRLLKAVAPVSAGNTRLLKEGGVKPRLDVEQGPQRAVGVKAEDMQPALKVPNRTSLKSPAQSPSLKGPTKPSSARLETGIAYRMAEHLKDPRVIAASYRDAEKWRKSQLSWKAMLESGIDLDIDQPMPAGFKLVDNKKVEEYIARFHRFLDEDAEVAFGDSPQLGQVKELLERGLAERFGEAKRVAVPKAVHDKIMAEFAQGNKALTAWIDRPTALWRALTLTVRPAFYVNNLVGQTMLLLAAQGMYRTIRTGVEFAQLGKEARKALDEGSGGVTFGSQSAFMRRESNKALGSKPFQLAVLRQIAPVIKDSNDLALRVGQAITDDPIRRYALLAELREPARALAAEKGIGFHDALETLLDNDQVMSHVEEKVMGDLVDFGNLTEGERAIVRRAAPFYSWVKGSSKRAGQMVLENPIRTNVYANIGEEGAEGIRDELGGAVPDFILGSILGNEKDDNGTERRLTGVTAGFSPFSTPADVLGMATGLADNRPAAGGSNPVSHLSPLFQIPIEAYTNRDSFSGDQLNKGQHSMLAQLLASTATSTPIASSAWSFHQKAGDPEYNERAMYRASITNEVLKFLGVPVRDLNVDRALAVGDESPFLLSGDMPAPGATTWVDGPNGHKFAIEDRGNPDDWESQ